MVYQSTNLGVATHITLLLLGIGCLVGSIYEMKVTSQSFQSLKNWKATSCHTVDVICGTDNHTYVEHCQLEGFYYYLEDTSVPVQFTFDNFGDQITETKVLSTYKINDTFTCYYYLGNAQSIQIVPPAFSNNFLAYEYLFSVFFAVLVGYGMKIWIYNRFEHNFMPEMGWYAAVDGIWDKKNKNSIEYPFDQLILLDMIFSMFLFMILAFANQSSLNHMYGFIPILILGIFGSFERYPDPNPLLTAKAKVHWVIANYAFTFSWCLTCFFSRIVLCAKDPFKDLLVTYIFSIFLFLFYLILKGYYLKMGIHLWRLYYSNSMVQHNEKTNN